MHIDITSLTAFVVLGAGFLIRPATAFLTKEVADGGPLGIVAGIVLSGLTAGGAALAKVGDIAHDWKNVFGVAAATAVTAGAMTAMVWSGKAVEWIHAKTDAWITSFVGSA